MYVIHTTAVGAQVLTEYPQVRAREEWPGRRTCLYGWGEDVYSVTDPDYREQIGAGPCRGHYVSERLTLTDACRHARMLVRHGVEAVITDADDWSQQPGNVPIRYDALHEHLRRSDMTPREALEYATDILQMRYDALGADWDEEEYEEYMTAMEALEDLKQNRWTDTCGASFMAGNICTRQLGHDGPHCTD